ncbi:MAG: hypothetical protein ACREB9_01425 [Thermoplasmata archaeon]
MPFDPLTLTPEALRADSHRRPRVRAPRTSLNPRLARERRYWLGILVREHLILPSHARRVEYRIARAVERFDRTERRKPLNAENIS